MAGGLPGARWTRDENFHLTLRFIGDVDEGVADDVDGALLEIDAPPFDVFIGGIGYFGKVKAARALIDASGRDIRLEVDGGVGPDNIFDVAAAGADTFVAGSAIFKAADYKSVVDQMRASLANVA